MTSPPTGGVTPLKLFPIASCPACIDYRHRTGRLMSCSACATQVSTDLDPKALDDFGRELAAEVRAEGLTFEETREVCRGRSPDLLWASPDCTHFSRALIDDARPAIDTWDAPTFAGRLPDPVVVPHDVWVELSSLIRGQVAAVVPSAPVKLAHYARGYRDASVEVLKLLQRIEAQQAALMPPLGDQ